MRYRIGVGEPGAFDLFQQGLQLWLVLSWADDDTPEFLTVRALLFNGWNHAFLAHGRGRVARVLLNAEDTDLNEWFRQGRYRFGCWS